MAGERNRLSELVKYCADIVDIAEEVKNQKIHGIEPRINSEGSSSLQKSKEETLEPVK